MATANDKTNVCRILDGKKIKYVHHPLDSDCTNGVGLAALLGRDCEEVFKTLVTVGKSGEHYVFVIPVHLELDLKKAAKTVGEKSIEMIPQKELLPLTGYVHGGCSPIGMKKQIRTVFDLSAKEREIIFFSAGKIGHQIEIAPAEAEKAIRIIYSDITTEEK